MLYVLIFNRFKNAEMKRPKITGWEVTINENNVQMATLNRERLIETLKYIEYLESKVENLDIQRVSGSFVLSREGAVDTIYWNGNEWQECKHNCPTYSYWKANEYAKVLNCHFTDAE